MKGIIYIATNLFNGKSYIGQTRASLNKRMSQHLKDAMTDSSNCFHLALMQYGKDAFEWGILDEFSGSKEEVIHSLNVAEEYHILKRRTLIDENGYNATKGGYSSDKFADAIKKRACANYGGKAVLQYDLNGNFIKEYESIASVKRELGKDHNKGKHFIGRAYKGFQWREKTNEYFPRKIEAYKQQPNKNKTVVVYTSDGMFYKSFNSISECHTELGKRYDVRKSIYGVSVKEHRCPEHLVFYDNGNMPKEIHVEIVRKKEKKEKQEKKGHTGVAVLQYSREGQLIAEYVSMREAQDITGILVDTISRSCKKPLPYKVHNNTKYIWRKKEEHVSEFIDIIQFAVPKESVVKYKMEHRVVQCNVEGSIIKIWENMYQASLQTGESHYLIRQQCKGIPTKKKTLFTWRYYRDTLSA